MLSEWLKIGYISNEIGEKEKVFRAYGDDYKEEINKVNNTGSLIGVSEMSIIDWLEWSTLR